MAHQVGARHETIPVPPVPEHTTYVEAGGVRLGVEGRVLNAAILSEHFSKDAEQARIFAETTAKYGTDLSTIDDVGVSVHVFDPRDAQEYLRFDIFDGDAHYHYITPGSHHIVVGFDVTANPDFLDWVFERLATTLAQMLEKAGVADAVSYVDQATVREALPGLRGLADEALTAQRQAHAVNA
jgi:hypothetical protein